MSNRFLNGWLAEREKPDFERLFGAPAASDNAKVVPTDEAIALIEAAARTPVTTHPWQMAEELFARNRTPYRRLAIWNQDANNCAGHAAARAVDAFALIRCRLGDRYELSPFENYVPWVWGVGKNEAGQTGTGGATIGAMLAMISQNGVLPVDTPGLPPYEGTSNQWAKRYGRQSKTAPYSQFWSVAKKYLVTVAVIPQDAELFHLACKGGYTLAFGTSQRLRMQAATSGSDEKRTWSASGSWMHAMAAYGYDATLDAIGIDNSHGDGFAWADRNVLDKVVNRARYFDAFVILDMQPRPGTADWHLIGKS